MTLTGWVYESVVGLDGERKKMSQLEEERASDLQEQGEMKS
jgi:hypothetical protein